MSYLRYLCLFEYNIQHILFGGWVRACVRAWVRVFFVYRCLSFVLFHFIIVFPLPKTASDYYSGVLELFLDTNRNSDSYGEYFL
jgi:hypothetical protein